MRALPPLLIVLCLFGCGKGAGASSPSLGEGVTILKGRTPTKVLPSSMGGSDLIRYELRQPLDAVLASVRKDAAARGWRESAPMGHPVFIATTPDRIVNIDVESGRLSSDGYGQQPDPGATIVTFTEAPTGGMGP